MSRITDQLTTWHLARMADCTAPDRADGIGFDPPSKDEHDPSAGADFLRIVAETWAERVDWGDYDPDESPHEIADGSVPVYTYPRWLAFVDLAAWQESGEYVAEFGELPADMTEAAGAILYIIAERLVYALDTWHARTDEEGENR